MQGERELCIQAGMDDYIAKPIHIDELTTALSRAPRRPGASPPRTAVDENVIDKLVSSLGEQGRESVAALIETFLGQVPKQLATLSTALELRDADVIRREAHTLKSNAASFGALPLAALCRQLEAGVKAGTLDGTSDLLDQISTELGRVTDELARIHTELLA